MAQKAPIEGILIARKNPGPAGRASDEIYFARGVDELPADTSGFQNNMTADGLKMQLSATLGISENIHLPEEGATRQPLEASSRHAMLFCCKHRTKSRIAGCCFTGRVSSSFRRPFATRCLIFSAPSMKTISLRSSATRVQERGYGGLIGCGSQRHLCAPVKAGGSKQHRCREIVECEIDTQRISAVRWLFVPAGRPERGRIRPPCRAKRRNCRRYSARTHRDRVRSGKVG